MSIIFYRIFNGVLFSSLIIYFVYSLSKIKKTKKEATEIQNESFAGFWFRFIAALIDLLVMVILISGLLQLLNFLSIELNEMIKWSVDIFTFWLYYSGFHASKWQATVGKKIIGLKLVDNNKNRVSFLRSSERFVGSCISQLFFYVGYLIIPFTKYKQGYHDLATNTYVIRIRGRGRVEGVFK